MTTSHKIINLKFTTHLMWTVMYFTWPLIVTLLRVNTLLKLSPEILETYVPPHVYEC